MVLSLYDPHTQALVPVLSEAPPALALGTTRGPEGLLALRREVHEDVLARQLQFHKTQPDGALKAELQRFSLDCLDDACEPESVRYWLLCTHYREPLELEAGAGATYEVLRESELQLSYLYATRKRLLELPRERIVPVQTQPAGSLAGFSDALGRALEHDLDTVRALAEAHAFLISVNALCDGALRKHGRVNASAVDSARAGVSTLLGSLGIGAGDPGAFLTRVRNRRARAQGVDVAAVERSVAERTEARLARNFVLADALHADLTERGIRLLDGPEGTTWSLD